MFKPRTCGRRMLPGLIHRDFDNYIQLRINNKVSKNSNPVHMGEKYSLDK